MKKFLVIIAAVAATLFAVACNKEQNAPDEPQQQIAAGEQITINASIPADITKVGLAYTGSGLHPTWSVGDKIRLADHSNSSNYQDFTLTAGEGTQNGTFSGTAVSASSFDISLLTTNWPADILAQTQAADESTDHLGYQLTLSDVSTYEDISFTSAWASSKGGSLAVSGALHLQVTLPSGVAAQVNNVTMVADKNIFGATGTMTIALSSQADNGTANTLDVFATIPSTGVVIPSGTALLFKFGTTDPNHSVYTRYYKTSSALNLAGGQLNLIALTGTNTDKYAGKNDDGSAEHPYLIADKYQMQAMHELLAESSTKYFKMVDDIDLSSFNPWEPLCLSSGEGKTIHFDGDGHVISNLTADDTYNYPSFIGFLSGDVNNVVFDHATITSGNTKDQSAGVVSGYIGGSSLTGACNRVIIRNSTLTSGGGSAYIGGLGARVGKASEFRNCQIINTTVSTNGGTCVGGLLSYIASNHDLIISDCYVEGVTVTGGGHYAGGLVAQIASNNPVTITRCHTTGAVKRSSSGRHFGGLVGSIQSANVHISNCYSTCSVTGYQFNGGLVGSWWSNSSGSIDHCFASGDITDVGNSGDGGLVGTIDVPGVTIKNSIAWNSKIKPNRYAEGNYSSGAIVGRTHPNTNLENNYRKPGMDLTAYWVPSSDFDHPNSNKVDDTYYIWRIGTDLVEANGSYSTATAYSSPNGVWAYHGKHLPSGTTVSPDNVYGWTASPAIEGIPVPDEGTEAGDYTGTNVWGLGTTVDIVDGVQWTNFHGTWQGAIREINIITTTLNEHNKLKVYYNYTDEGKLYLNEKCEYVTNAVAATNGCMTSQFVRVDDMIKKSPQEISEWTNNCALTIDDGVVDIAKVASNSEAATLGNSTVGCAGPLLVWKGNKLVASDEWKAADTENWLTTTHPRTAIGINKEGTKLIQVTVDGRWESGSDDAKKATGMSTDLLAELMKELGCYKAMNLDGGGGSQMWVYGKGDIHNIVNHPHNAWPVYGTDPAVYYWIKNNEVARRSACCAFYIQSDLK